MKYNTVGWFEIPVNDMERAAKFYGTVLDCKIEIQDMGGALMGFFPNGGDVYGATGSLMKYESYVPSYDGTLVYITCQDLQNELNRIPDAGGTILKEKTQISPEHGYMAAFEDSEGNRVALHSRD
tara:strand:- start:223 stop:597 length:375 start_codon:yes stop_codon:yes gene_type:complete